MCQSATLELRPALVILMPDLFHPAKYAGSGYKAMKFPIHVRLATAGTLSSRDQ